VTGLSWGPSTEPAFLSAELAGQNNKADSHEFTLPVKRLVSCSNDKNILLWEFHQNDQVSKSKLGEHKDKVKDIAWCSNIGLL
jgi:WD40 repeat protein